MDSIDAKGEVRDIRQFQSFSIHYGRAEEVKEYTGAVRRPLNTVSVVWVSPILYSLCR